MKFNTLYLPRFSHRLLGGRAARAVESLSCKRLDGFSRVAAKFIARGLLDGSGERERVFTPWVTFCAFLGQVLQRDCACREAVNRVQAWRSARSRAVPSTNTAAYCRARARLGVSALRQAHEALVQRLEQRSSADAQWQGRAVKLIDGCGYSMPDTDANRAVYPYAGCQRPGGGFPTGKLVGLFSLAGHLVRFVHASWKTHEMAVNARVDLTH